MQIARQGWGEQKSQNGGANPTLSGPATANYHLWAVADEARAGAAANAGNGDLFHNGKVSIDTGIAGLTRLVKGNAPAWLSTGLKEIDAGLTQFENEAFPSGAKAPVDSAAPMYGLKPVPFTGVSLLTARGAAVAHKLAPIYRQTLDLRAKVAAGNLEAEAKAGLLLELDAKIGEFQSALKELLGLDLIAFTAKAGNAPGGGPFRGGSADEMPRSVAPGEEFRVRVHTAQATAETRLNRVWLESRSGDAWKNEIPAGAIDPAAPVSDPDLPRTRPPKTPSPPQPYFTRPNIEQPYYDLTHPEWRLRSFAPYPLAAWAEFTFDGLPIRLGQVGADDAARSRPGRRL